VPLTCGTVLLPVAVVQVHEEVKERWIPAATRKDYGERLFQIATTNNPFM